MIRKRKNNIVFGALFLTCVSGAQEFHFSALLDSVRKDGFYSIPVTAGLSSYLKTDLSDIRIRDEKGQWIPHIINWPGKNLAIENVLFELPVTTKENGKTTTLLIVRNKYGENLNNLVLNLKNSAANRRAIVSGSDDGKNWFTITDSITLAPGTNNNKPVLTISFPKVNYAYFKVTIANGNEYPYNIFSVDTNVPAVSVEMLKKKEFVVNPAFSFSQTDSAGFSLLRIKNDAKFQFNVIRPVISSPHFYNRRAKLFSTYMGGPFRSFFYTPSLQEYVLSSNNMIGYETALLNDSALYLLIENGDNPPLRVDTFATLQNSRELIAWLEQGKQYQLFFADSHAPDPDYDLQKFREKIPDTLEKLKIGTIKAIVQMPREPSKHERNYWRYLMWPFMLIVLLVLGYFTFSLIKDVNKQKKSV
jgi:hypothetical protein